MKAPALLWGDGRINVWQSNAALSDGAAGALVCRSHSTRLGEGLAGAVPPRYSASSSFRCSTSSRNVYADGS